MSLLLALSGSIPQTITASGLSNPFASGSSALTLNVTATGLSQEVGLGSSSLTGGATEQPSGGVWFSGWDWQGFQKREVRPRAQRVSCRGIDQPVAFGNSRLSQRIGARGIGRSAGTGTVKVSLTIAARGIRVSASTAPCSRLMGARPRLIRAHGLRVGASVGSPRIESANPDFTDEVAMILAML